MFFSLFHDAFSTGALLAVSENVRNVSLLIGACTFCGGVLTLLANRRGYDEILNSHQTLATIRHESKKYRRRAMASTLITSVGCMIGGLYWVQQPRVFVIFIGMILVTLLVIMGLALADMFSIGLRSITRTDEPDRKAMIEQYLKSKQAGDDPEEPS